MSRYRGGGSIIFWSCNTFNPPNHIIRIPTNSPIDSLIGVNRLDNYAVVGKHPKFENVYLATGFTGRGLMQAPGIGRALTELITTGSYQSIDISNMAVERVLGKKARPEPYVL